MYVTGIIYYFKGKSKQLKYSYTYIHICICSLAINQQIKGYNVSELL